MFYFVSESSTPLEAFCATRGQLNEIEAIGYASELAEKNPGVVYYVHEFQPSKLIYRASTTITVEGEYLDGDPE